MKYLLYVRVGKSIKSQKKTTQNIILLQICKIKEVLNDLFIIVTVLLLIETGWLTAGIVWLVKFYSSCNIEKAKETVLGKFFFLGFC